MVNLPIAVTGNQGDSKRVFDITTNTHSGSCTTAQTAQRERLIGSLKKERMASRGERLVEEGGTH